MEYLYNTYNSAGNATHRQWLEKEPTEAVPLDNRMCFPTRVQMLQQFHAFYIWRPKGKSDKTLKTYSSFVYLVEPTEKVYVGILSTPICSTIIIGMSILEAGLPLYFAPTSDLLQVYY